LHEACLHLISERPLHSMEIVLNVILKWSLWSDDFCRTCYLCLKHNYVYEKITPVSDTVSVTYTKLSIKVCMLLSLLILSWVSLKVCMILASLILSWVSKYLCLASLIPSWVSKYVCFYRYLYWVESQSIYATSVTWYWVELSLKVGMLQVSLILLNKWHVASKFKICNYYFKVLYVCKTLPFRTWCEMLLIIVLLPARIWCEMLVMFV